MHKGAVLLADASGFTVLTERLSSKVCQSRMAESVCVCASLNRALVGLVCVHLLTSFMHSMFVHSFIMRVLQNNGAEILCGILNEFFDEMVRIIHDHGGDVIKVSTCSMHMLLHHVVCVREGGTC